MANCRVCGCKAGIGKDFCDACSTEAARRRAQVADAKPAAAEAQAEDGRAASADAYLATSLDKIVTTLNAGKSVSLHRTVYVPVDAQMETIENPSSLDLREVNEAGYAGWEVVGVVPRTYSGTKAYVTTSSMTLRDWGGQKTQDRLSLSGNVIGAYFVMRLELTLEMVRDPSIDVREAILANDKP